MVQMPIVDIVVTPVQDEKLVGVASAFAATGFKSVDRNAAAGTVSVKRWTGTVTAYLQDAFGVQWKNGADPDAVVVGIRRAATGTASTLIITTTTAANAIIGAQLRRRAETAIASAHPGALSAAPNVVLLDNSVKMDSATAHPGAFFAAPFVVLLG